MQDVIILPIFNRTPFIQRSLAHIEGVTSRHCFNDYRSVQYLEENALSHFRKEDKDGSDNYVFAAFNNNEIIGFIRGNGNLINNFFVLPEYSGRGIGTMLLKHAEFINHNYNNKMQLYSLSTSIKFYKKHGYIKNDASNNLVKELNLKTDYDYIIPLFNAKSKLETHHNINNELLTDNCACFAHIRNNNLLGYITKEKEKIVSNTISDKFNTYSKLYPIFSEYLKKFTYVNPLLEKSK